MSNIDIFRALSCTSRLKILKLLLKKEMHLSGIARELGLSVPVISRHIKVLEKVNLVNKKVFGNTYILSAKIKSLENIIEPLIEESSIEIEKKKSIFDALKQVPEIKIKKIGKNQYISSINGEDGFYIYEVNGKLPKKPINKYTIDKNVTLDLKKLVTVKKKKISINIKESG
jgi:predicted transcriptional regulator